jgi:predicted MFS family arabinose efflux permease
MRVTSSVAEGSKRLGVFGLGGVKLKSATVLMMLFAISAVSYADRSIMTVTQEPMKADLGLSDTQLGLLNGPIFAIFYAVLGIPIARLAERASRKRIIAAAVAVWSVATALCGTVTGFASLALARASVGGAESASPPSSHSIISDYFPAEQRGRAMAVLSLAIPVGLMLGTFVGGMVTHLAGWRVAFAVMGAAGVVLAALAALLISEPERGAQEHGAAASDLPPLSHRQAFAILLSSRTFWLLLLASALAGTGSHGVSSFSASYFMRRHHLTLPEVAGLLALGKGVVGFAGVLVGGFLADRLARRGTRAYLIVPGLGALGSCILLLAAYQQTDWSLAASCFVPAFFFSNWIPSPSFAAVQNMVDVRLRATGAALLLFFVTVIGGAGPWIVGALSDMAAQAAYVGDFAAECRGGHALASAGAAAAKACATASADGLQRAMFIPISFYGLVAVVFALAVWSTGRNLKL